jgi:CubicO group peptidase (beta-lactamase class C family)
LAAVRRKLAKVDRLIEQAIERGELPGAVVSSVLCSAADEPGPPTKGKRRGAEELSYRGVHGAAVLSPERHEATEDTTYDLASLTKVLATTPALMLLVAEGKLALDQPVCEILPAFAERGKEAISVRHLLAHCSGLRPWRAYHADLRERERKSGERLLGTSEGRDSIVSRILRSAPVHEPGEASVYGDLSFIVLGEVVAELAQEGLDSFCMRRIYEPLGMTHTGFRPIPSTGGRAGIAATEDCAWRDKVVWGEVHDPNAWAMGGVAGHSGLFGTVEDVLRFAREMLAADRGESEIFSEQIAYEFFRRQELTDGGDWALGWDTPTPGVSTSGKYFSPRSIGHTGFTGTSLWIDLERGWIVVMLSNRVHLVAKRSRFELRPQVHDLIWEAFLAA